MDTYRGVKQQIALLERKAAELRRAEAAKVITDIKKKIAKFELQPEDIFDHVSIAEPVEKKAKRDKPSTAAKVASKSADKYRDPATGRTWTGHGKPPNWIKGKDREAFLIGAVAGAKPVSAKQGVSKKRVVSGRSKAVPAKTKKPTVSKPVTKRSPVKRTSTPKVTVLADSEPAVKVATPSHSEGV